MSQPSFTRSKRYHFFHVTAEITGEGSLEIQPTTQLILHPTTNLVASPEGSFIIKSTASFVGNISVGGDLFVGGSMIITGTTLHKGDNVFGDEATDEHKFVGITTASGDLTISETIHGKSTASIDGKVISASTLWAKSTASIDGSLNVTGNTNINGSLLVDKNASVDGTLNIGGTTTLESTLHAKSTASLDGNVNLAGSLLVNRNASIDGNMAVGGNTTLTGSLLVDKNASIDGTLNVGGLTTLTGSLLVDKNASIDGTLNVGGLTTITGSLLVDKNASIDGTLAIGGALNVNASGSFTNLYVSPASSMVGQIIELDASQNVNAFEINRNGGSGGDLLYVDKDGNHITAGTHGAKGYSGNVTTQTNTDYTALPTDDVILVSTGGTTRTISFSAVSGLIGKIYHIKKIDAGVGLVTLNPDSTETIDGDLTPDIIAQFESFSIVSDGSNWHVI